MPKPAAPPHTAPPPEPTAAPRFEQKGWGPGLGQDLDEGDKITVTAGAERYTPVLNNGFDVGPVSVTVTLRQGEGIDEFFLRAHRFLDVAFEAEFALKRRQFWARLNESKSQG